jgi:ElaB/YqjD/DUF883 family membrane-anchored ribosome-binding protein
MEFNIKKYLMENKLGKVSSLNEDGQPTLADLGRGAKPNQDLEVGNDDEFDNAPELDVAPQADVDDMDDMQDEPAADSWDAPEADDSADFEQEPAGADVAQPEPALSGIHKKQAQLQTLVDQKDRVLMQYKSGQMSLDQYKEAIGNIPQQIKRLRDQIDQAMDVSVDDDTEDSEMA